MPRLISARHAGDSRRSIDPFVTLDEPRRLDRGLPNRTRDDDVIAPLDLVDSARQFREWDIHRARDVSTLELETRSDVDDLHPGVPDSIPHFLGSELFNHGGSPPTGGSARRRIFPSDRGTRSDDRAPILVDMFAGTPFPRLRVAKSSESGRRIEKRATVIIRRAYHQRGQTARMAAPSAYDESTIFETPLLEIELDLATGASVLAKAEWYNLYAAPYGGGSVKSRIAKGMLDVAEERGTLVAGKTIIEPTSGNTGSEIARLGRSRGYEVEIVMPDNAAGGKIRAIRDAGATIHFVDAVLGYDAVIDACDRLLTEDPGRYYRANQYENPANPGTHERTTAVEIYEATEGAVTHFIAGIGTGGTITGTGRGLHERDETIRVVGFEPAEALHAIDGLKYLRTGDHYHPGTYDESVLDDKRYVTTEAAYRRARELRETSRQQEIVVEDTGQHGLDTVREHLRVAGDFLVGTSSGAGIDVVYQLDMAGALADDDVVVVLFGDRGDKYADIPLWSAVFDDS